MSGSYSHDVFISHASEDKDRFVRPLAEALRASDLDVWFDEWDLEVGDSLIDRINQGLASSRFGVVVLSSAFFAKEWPRAELQALATLEMSDGRARLLPVWLDVGPDEIAAAAPLLLGRVALRAAVGVNEVARGLIGKISRDKRRAVASPVASPPFQELHPREIATQALPTSYSPPLPNDESGFVVRTVTSLRVALGADAYLTSQHKRAFQALLSDSSIDDLFRELIGPPWARPRPAWEQTQPNTGTVVSLLRAAETMGGRGGSIEGHAGLLLRSYPASPSRTSHLVVHTDLVLRPPSETHGGTVLSLEDFQKLLSEPATAARREIAPVLSALLSGAEEPEFVAQSVVAIPNRDSFEPYLNLAAYAGDRVPGATGPHAAQWSAMSTSEFADVAWEQAVIRMIDRLFSDGSFLDYEASLERLARQRAATS